MQAHFSSLGTAKLSGDTSKLLLEVVTLYRHIVGSLIYMTITRPNLRYAVGWVSQFMQAPRKPYLDATRCILWYVNSMLHYRTFYEAIRP